ncbi:MAG: precorrin-8X methylmutase [Rhodobacter sp.]|nr:precorrin-8X methylmutase [Rhodobacter sp.]
MRPYLKDPETIYARSFAIVRREARLDRFDPDMAQLATRVIHACGMPDIADRIVFSPGAGETGRKALATGAPILCDCEMVSAGISHARLPLNNDVIVTLNDRSVPALARQSRTTRSAAAVDLWRDRIDGAVAVIGNAPTALFRLLERLDDGWPKPAVILGFPVGFIGASDSKTELASNPRGCEFVALLGRRGGSAMASAAVNALAEHSRGVGNGE